jgi:hypothetical protein
MQLRRFAPALAGLGAVLSTAPAWAVYTAPAAFTTAISDSTEAVGVLAAALIGVAAAAVVIMIALKYVKRIKSAG